MVHSIWPHGNSTDGICNLFFFSTGTGIRKSTNQKLAKFDFVFLLQLRHVDKVSSLVQLVIQQHEYLEQVDPEFLTNLFTEKSKYYVLILLDGYDEYSNGMNKDIDKVIKQGFMKSFIILTSRPGYLEKHIRDTFDGEIIIKGLSNKNINLCASKYLQSKERSDVFLKQAKEIGINELLRVPIILLMTCMVYDEKQMLPTSKTQLVRIIFELCMDRTTLKIFNRKSYELDDIQTLINKLGELSWKSLQNDVQHLLLHKVGMLLCLLLCIIHA